MTDISLLNKVAEGIAQGEYSLLLGAGASVGAVGGNGRLLPTGVELRDALINDFGIKTEGESISLTQAYDYLRRNCPKELTQYLKKWFQGCDPTWQRLIAEFNWRRIWTFNIDDVVEKAFYNEGRPNISLTWNERFFERDLSNAQQIIHLHGLAARLDENQLNDDVLVFSISEYTRAVTYPRTWHKVFFDEFAGHPFIIVGASLVEEIDLAEVLESGSAALHSTGYPSVVITPNITSFRREQLEAAGLAIAEDNGESFLSKVLDEYREARSDLEEVYGKGTPGIRRFQQQFIDLRTATPRDQSNRDFFSGYHPTWKTILDDNDATLDKTKQISADCIVASTDENIYQRVILLTGDPGSGKSTGLLRIAKDLIGKGITPFLFRGDEYMDIESTIEWLKAMPRTVLLIDDCADFSVTIQRLAERCKEERVRILLVCSDRSTRLPLIKDRIDPQYLQPEQIYWYGRLTQEDIDCIIDKLHSRARLGMITRWNRDRQRSHFANVAGRRLFDAMSELENGIGFKERAESIYQGLPTSNLKNLYAAACICYEQSIPLPTGIGVSFAGVLPRDLHNLVEQKCNGILLLTRNGIRPPHRITASLVVNALPWEVRSEVSLSLAKSLAPHVDELAMRTGTGEYRIVRRLMDQETVSRLVGQQNAREWYESLRRFYDWNARYWDQRALLESELGDHETARSYAERSIQALEHPFGYNTLGTVLLRMAIRRGNPSPLLEGIRNLDRARRFQEWGEREHPFVTFFTSLHRYAES